MSTVHAIVYNYPVIEDGKVVTIEQIMLVYGYFLQTKDAYSKVDSLNYGWALDKSQDCGHLVEDYDSLYDQLLNEFCEQFGTAPYDFVSINNKEL